MGNNDTPRTWGPVTETSPMPLTEFGPDSDLMMHSPESSQEPTKATTKPIEPQPPAPTKQEVVTVISEPPPPSVEPAAPVCVPDKTTTEGKDPDATKDERRLRHWVIRVFVSVVAVLFVATVLTMLYVYVVRGDKLDGGIIGSFLQAVTEIIKILSAPANPGG